jgi:ubiquinone/menaquinone biosynthesis C-methylase UbiE
MDPLRGRHYRWLSLALRPASDRADDASAVEAAKDEVGKGGVPVRHADHVALLRQGIPEPGGLWADFGSGTGAFTLALAELIGPEGELYSVDKDRGALRTQAQRLQAQFPSVSVSQRVADFTQPLDLPPLDGLVMANSLHFHRDKEPILWLARSYLKPGGRLILVEYGTDRGNRWVPYPLSFQSWQDLARHSGFVGTQLLVTRPSRFLGKIYSALSFAPKVP